MTTVTASKAADLERRLSVLESRVGTNRQSINNGTLASVDERLARLKTEFDRRLAVAASESTTSNTTTAAGSKVHTEQSWKDLQKLLKELDPGIALTHQQQPLLYKRQQVLAAADELGRDFGQLDALLKLLLSGTRPEASAAASSDTASVAATMSSKARPTSAEPASTPSKQKQQQQKKKKEEEQKKLQQQQQLQAVRGTPTEATLRLDQVTQAPVLTQHLAVASQPRERARVETLKHTLRQLHGRTEALQQRLQHLLECYHTATMAVSEKIILADEVISSKLAAAKE